jgi:proteasome beta subunit
MFGTASGDFARLLQRSAAGFDFLARRSGLEERAGTRWEGEAWLPPRFAPSIPRFDPVPGPLTPPAPTVDVHGTTVIAVKYKGGVLNVGDRRATAAFAVMYDRAEKVLALDDYTLIAISGSYAKAIEVVRYLRHAFKYFERSQLQRMSLDGKLSELARVIAANVPNLMNGIGAFIPVLSTYDLDRNEGRIFFYDGMGARFETAEYGAAGSGAERIRGCFEYVLRTKGPFHEMSFDEALYEALLLLEIAAELDTATGGSYKHLPLAKFIDAEGIQDVPEEKLRETLQRIGAGPATVR